MKKFAIAILVLALAFVLDNWGIFESDRIWVEFTGPDTEDEITTIVVEDGSVIERYTSYESSNQDGD